MHIVADLQIHSKYARAVSHHMTLPHIWMWARRKGIHLIATGDWTHPLWMKEIEAHLFDRGDGLFSLKKEYRPPAPDHGIDPLFLLGTEISCIYSQGGKVRRIHLLIWAPSLKSASHISDTLISRGANLHADGRPIVGLSGKEIAELVFSIDEQCLIIPAHAWTPWFSLYGSFSGFDSLDECFGAYASSLYAIETGLSSDPAMNWRIKELDHRSIVSFSDAHSGAKLGREATVFDLDTCSYQSIREAVRMTSEKNRIAYTVEFFPEEGKYHLTGHRSCKVIQYPQETNTKGTMCPVCGKPLTVGVLHRVEQLSSRSEDALSLDSHPIPETQVLGISSRLFPRRPPFVRMVPLLEIIAASRGVKSTSKKVETIYLNLVDHVTGEFELLLATRYKDLVRCAGKNIADAIHAVRLGELTITPGYDGVFGTISLEKSKKKTEETQLGFFDT